MPETPGLQSVQELLSKIHAGELVIPYFQRSFEWRPKMVCDLIESIMQDYYTGLILLWDLDSEESKNEKWDTIWGASKISKNPGQAILDGQQRLSSLYYAVYNPPKKFPNRTTYYNFYIDLIKIINEDYEGSVSYRYMKKHKNWNSEFKEKDKWIKTGIFPIEILSAPDPENLSQPYINSIDFEETISKFKEYNKEKFTQEVSVHRCITHLSKVLNYKFVYYSLGSNRKLSDICNIFARVNEKGMRLSTFDLMNAFLYSKGVHLRKNLWDNLSYPYLKEIDENMNETLLKVISLYKQNYCSTKYIYNLIPGTKILKKDEKNQIKQEVLVASGKDFVTLWKKAVKYMEKTREIIMNHGEYEFAAIKKEYIPTTSVLTVIAAILWKNKGKLSKNMKNKLEKWYWSALISDDYSGSVDSIIAKDFKDLEIYLHENIKMERIAKISKNFINEIDFFTIKRGSVRYKMILSLLAVNKCEDFFLGRIIGHGDFNGDRIDDHHIFPVKMKKTNIANFKKFSKTKDMIVNRTLLFNETNQKISNKKPSVYLKEMIKEKGERKVKNLLFKHFIDDNAMQAMLNDNYDEFIKYRERSMKKYIIEKLEL